MQNEFQLVVAEALRYVQAAQLESDKHRLKKNYIKLIGRILVYNSNQMHKSQSLFYLITAVHVSGVTITHLQEHKTTVTTTFGNRYTVIDKS